MQGADGKARFADQRIEQRRFAGTDAAEHRDMHVAMRDLVEHYTHCRVVLCQDLPHTLRQAAVVDQLMQALARQLQVIGARVASRVFARGLAYRLPSRQCA